MSKKLSKHLRKLREELEAVKFKCKNKGCFECCTAIQFTIEEAQRMNQCLRKQGIDKPPQGKGEEYCEYLNGDGKCSVYEERPIICRAFGKVDSPLMTCSYNRNCPKIKQSLCFLKYMTHDYGELVQNKNGAPDDFINKVKQGDPKSIMACAAQYSALYKQKMITKEELEEYIKQLEEIMQTKDDSLLNYIK